LNSECGSWNVECGVKDSGDLAKLGRWEVEKVGSWVVERLKVKEPGIMDNGLKD
jgi:hypothetical protein